MLILGNLLHVNVKMVALFEILTTFCEGKFWENYLWLAMFNKFFINGDSKLNFEYFHVTNI